MARLPLYQVDAFAPARFQGNPAAVVPLEAWLPDELLQAVAAENNLAETAFLKRAGEDWDLRWFTPAVEVDLCGHATLASGYVVDRWLDPGCGEVRFQTRSGPLAVRREEGLYRLDLPAKPPLPVEAPALAAILGGPPVALFACDKLMALLPDQRAVEAVRPDLRRLAELPWDGLIVTAPGREVDFVSRYFAPHAGIDEDPVTGSAHCLLTPFWAERLGRQRLTARQLSPRGGALTAELAGDRVRLYGEVQPYLEGWIEV